MTDTLGFVLREIVPGLNQGLWMSLILIAPAALLGAGIGVTAGALRVYGPSWLRWFVDLYVALFRGTPLVVQLYFWYFALPYLSLGDFRIVLSPVGASILGFGLCSGAYQSEYIRGGLLSIKRGQIKAAQALGMSPLTCLRHIVMPQAFRRALPGCGNEIVYLIKYSSLASIITVNELTGTARSIAKATWRNIEVYAVVGIYYLVLVTLAAYLLHRLEKKLRIPGFEQAR